MSSFNLMLSQPARFSGRTLAPILAQGVSRPMPAPLDKGDAVARIRAQLGTGRN